MIESAAMFGGDRLPARLLAVILWISGLIWLTTMMTVMMIVALVISSEKTDWLSRIYCRGQLLMIGVLCRYHVSDKLDQQTPYLFVSNHVNLLDHVTFYPATPHFKQGIELKSHFKIPVYGWFMKQRGTLGVARGSNRDNATLESDIQATIDKGHSLLAFPEGTRTLTGQVGPFKTGILRIAVRHNIPIAPVAVSGMFEVLKKGSWIIHPSSQVVVRVLDPITTVDYHERDVAKLADQLQALINQSIETDTAKRIS